MKSEFYHYFPDLKEQEATFARSPFSNSFYVSNVADKTQEQFIKLKNDLAAHDSNCKILSQFWYSMSKSYPQISKLTF